MVKSMEYLFSYVEAFGEENVPIITLEVLDDDSKITEEPIILLSQDAQTNTEECIEESTDLECLEDLEKNLQSNLHGNLLNDVHNNSQKNIQTNLQSNLQNNSQKNLPTNLQINLQINSQKNLPTNLQSNLQINSQKNSETNLKSNSQKNLDTNLHGNLQNNVQKNIQTILQNNVQNNSQKKSQTILQNNVQHNLQKNLQTFLHNNVQNKSQKNFQMNYTNENETGESELNREEDEYNNKRDSLEYVIREDGCVVCKLCGEVLASRTQWYRHKYRLHVVKPWYTRPIFRCEPCHIFFKDRKAHLGHIASRHSELNSICQPVLYNAQVKITATKQYHNNNVAGEEVAKNTDPELEIPKTTFTRLPSNATTYNVVSVISGNKTKSKHPELRKWYKNPNDGTLNTKWQEERSRDEKLVADIINRVKRECEAQGADCEGPAKRGHSRRPPHLQMI